MGKKRSGSCSAGEEDKENIRGKLARQLFNDLKTSRLDDEDPDQLALRYERLGLPSELLQETARNVIGILKTLNAAYRDHSSCDAALNAQLRVLTRILEGKRVLDARIYAKVAVRHGRYDSRKKEARYQVLEPNSLEEVGSEDPSEHRGRTPAEQDVKERAVRWLRDRGYEFIPAVLERECSQADVADDLGMDPSTFSRRIRGEKARLRRELDSFRDAI